MHSSSLKFYITTCVWPYRWIQIFLKFSGINFELHFCSSYMTGDEPLGVGGSSVGWSSFLRHANADGLDFRCCLLTTGHPCHRCAATCLQLRATWHSHCSLALRAPTISPLKFHTPIIYNQAPLIPRGGHDHPRFDSYAHPYSAESNYFGMEYHDHEQQNII